MSICTWQIKLYDLDGDPITANYSTYPNSHSTTGTTNQIVHAYERSVSYFLNGVDECEFKLHLDDPMAFKVRRLSTIVKVYRQISDPTRGVTFGSTTVPIFAGVVGYTLKSGSTNEMVIKAYNPMWRLKFRFHLLNHYLNNNIDTGDLYTQSELMWKLIDLVNNAFGGASYLGIDEGTFAWGLPDEPQIAPFFVPMGSNTWTNIFDNIMTREAGVDLIPEYQHIDGDPTLMLFSTDEKRGTDISDIFKLNYHTDPDGDEPYLPNLDDLTEEEAPAPDDFANYLWAVGHGGPNSGIYAARSNTSAVVGSDGQQEIGNYMALVETEVESVTAAGKIADAELKQKKTPSAGYTVAVSPAVSVYYDYDFTLGDVVALNADRGALVVEDKLQRIFQAVIRNGEDNIESYDLLIADDFYSKVAGT